MKVRPYCRGSGFLAAAVAAFVTVAAQAAAPRQPQETLVRHPSPATAVEMDVWLRRLVGKFRWEGVLDVEPRFGREDGTDVLAVRGYSDCVAIGSGPGVHCVLDVRWNEKYTFMGKPVAVPNLTPAMMMFGIDAARERMLYLQVDNKGLPHGGVGSLVGSTAEFRAPCISTDPELSSMERPGQSPIPQGGQSSGGGDPGQGNSGGFDPGASGGSNFDTTMGSESTTRNTPAIGGNSGEPAVWMRCLWITRISANEDSKVVFINIAYGERSDPTNRYTLTLRRDGSEDQEEERRTR